MIKIEIAADKELETVQQGMFTVPTQATSGSAGIDLVAAEFVAIEPGETKLVKTNFKWAIPEGYVGLVCSRSGLALNSQVFVLNAPGVVDSDYRGNVGVILHNAGKVVRGCNPGDRIAQMVITKYEKVEFELLDNLDETVRGEGGFGSTGTK